MIWDVCVGVGDMPAAVPSGAVQALRLNLDSTHAPLIDHGVWDLLTRHGMEETPRAAVDLLRFALAAYSADLRAPRATAADRWTRHFALHLPVLEVDRWRAATDTVTSLLRFLTGDVWEVDFLATDAARPPNRKLRKVTAPLDATSVCLFSGGMDSLIGASNALSRGDDLLLVSHSGVGGKYSTPAQKELADALALHYGDEHLRWIPAKISPPDVPSLRASAHRADSDTSMRSRSLIFLALGVVVAASLPDPVPLIVPENGFISINPPLTRARTGSHSTRTTHPHTVRLFRELLTAIGVPADVGIELPFRFSTKGEMTTQAADQSWLRRHVLRTVSCGKANRTAIAAAKRGLGEDVRHCGYCVPCIVRRGALHAAGITGERYLEQVLGQAVLRRENGGGSKTAADHKAFRTAVARGLGLADLLASGPIEPSDAAGYLDVVRRGLAEAARVI